MNVCIEKKLFGENGNFCHKREDSRKANFVEKRTSEENKGWKIYEMNKIRAKRWLEIHGSRDRKDNGRMTTTSERWEGNKSVLIREVLTMKEKYIGVSFLQYSTQTKNNLKYKLFASLELEINLEKLMHKSIKNFNISYNTSDLMWL